jgi:hypothetical protein
MMTGLGIAQHIYDVEEVLPMKVIIPLCKENTKAISY